MKQEFENPLSAIDSLILCSDQIKKEFQDIKNQLDYCKLIITCIVMQEPGKVLSLDFDLSCIDIDKISVSLTLSNRIKIYDESTAKKPDGLTKFEQLPRKKQNS